jgi:hypothetical protein
MRKLICAVVLSGLALGFQGCGEGGDDSPTAPAARGNWVGTLTGVHAGLHLNGTCALEMNLDPLFNGQWFVDCAGGSSRGDVLAVTTNNLVAMTLITSSPASSCPWAAVSTFTVSTIDGTFQVVDCATHQVVSTGTLTLRRR